MHAEGIVHRDLKPQNILLDFSNKAKLTDLGISRALENKDMTTGGTIAYTTRYVSRETIVDEVTSFSSDIWSLGLVIYEIISENKAWGDISTQNIVFNLSNSKSPLSENFDKVIKNEDVRYLIRECCNYDMIKRPKAGDVYNRLCEIYQKLI